MTLVKRCCISLLLLLFSSAAFAQTPWITVPLAGFDNLIDVEIVANFPAANPAMDNLVLSDGGPAVVMDFEGVVVPGEVSGPVSPYLEDGFLLDASASEHAIFSATTPTINTNGSDIFGWCGACGGPITLTIVSSVANPFSLQSIDVSSLDLFGGPQGVPLVLTITGNFVGGGSIQQTIPITEPPAVPAVSLWSILAMILVLMLGAVALNRRYNFF